MDDDLRDLMADLPEPDAVRFIQFVELSVRYRAAGQRRTPNAQTSPMHLAIAKPHGDWLPALM